MLIFHRLSRSLEFLKAPLALSQTFMYFIIIFAKIPESGIEMRKDNLTQLKLVFLVIQKNIGAVREDAKKIFFPTAIKLEGEGGG